MIWTTLKSDTTIKQMLGRHCVDKGLLNPSPLCLRPACWKRLKVRSPHRTMTCPNQSELPIRQIEKYSLVGCFTLTFLTLFVSSPNSTPSYPHTPQSGPFLLPFFWRPATQIKSTKYLEFLLLRGQKGLTIIGFVP